MNQITKDITTKLAILSITAFVLGSCIITYHLSSFQILDYDLLKPHAIIVGLVFLLFVGINIVIFTYRAGSTENNHFNTFKLLIQALVKIPLVSLLFFLICDPSLILDSNYKLHFFSYSVDIKIISLILGMSTGSMILNTLAIGKVDSSYNKKVRNVCIFLSLLSILLLFLTFIRNSNFLSVLGLETSVCFFTNMYIMAYRSSKLHDEDQKEKKEGEKTKWSDDTFLDFGKSELGKRLRLLCNLIIIIFICLQVTLGYSSIVYPLLSQSFGGGKLTKMSFIVGSDTINGNKLYETEKYVFLSKKDSTIIKLDWSNINTIIKNPAKEKY